MDDNRASGRTEFVDFSFAYDNKNFSDRILWIKIMRDVQEVRSDGDNTAKLKHRTICQQQEYADNDAMLQVICEKKIDMDQESSFPVGMTSSGDNDQETTFGVKTIHVNSAILAAKSPFFHKLFSNGMQESEQGDITIHISCSEEEAFMELLNFIYCGTLVSPTTTAVILDILEVADKFEVMSCVRQCVAMLQSMTMTLESLSLILNLPSSVQMIDVVQQLVNNAKGFLRNHFSWMNKFEEEYMQLPLVVIEEVLSSDKLGVVSEDHLYDWVMKWAKTHYHNDAERGEVLRNKLIKLIRFPQMTDIKLKLLLFDDEIRQIASDLISDAILFKAEPSRFCERNTYALNENHKRYCPRSYMYTPIRVLALDTPFNEYILFWDIKIDQFVRDSIKLQISEAFHLSGVPFNLMAYCNLVNDDIIKFFLSHHKQRLNWMLNYSFSVRTKPSNYFSEISRGLVKFDNGHQLGPLHGSNLKVYLLTADYAPYVIDNAIHLRVAFTPQLKNPL